MRVWVGGLLLLTACADSVTWSAPPVVAPTLLVGHTSSSLTVYATRGAEPLEIPNVGPDDSIEVAAFERTLEDLDYVPGVVLPSLEEGQLNVGAAAVSLHRMGEARGDETIWLSGADSITQRFLEFMVPIEKPPSACATFDVEEVVVTAPERMFSAARVSPDELVVFAENVNFRVRVSTGEVDRLVTEPPDVTIASGVFEDDGVGFVLAEGNGRYLFSATLVNDTLTLTATSASIPPELGRFSRLRGVVAEPSQLRILGTTETSIRVLRRDGNVWNLEHEEPVVERVGTDLQVFGDLAVLAADSLREAVHLQNGRVSRYALPAAASAVGDYPGRGPILAGRGEPVYFNGDGYVPIGFPMFIRKRPQAVVRYFDGFVFVYEASMSQFVPESGFCELVFVPWPDLNSGIVFGEDIVLFGPSPSDAASSHVFILRKK